MSDSAMSSSLCVRKNGSHQKKLSLYSRCKKAVARTSAVERFSLMSVRHGISTAK